MTNPTERFIATMFSGAGHANADSGLLIATSSDGVNFRNLRASHEPIYAPAGGMRDPSVLRWRGRWLLVYSYGHAARRAPLLFLAQSPDLLHWSALGALRLMADGANNYVDVPQWIVDVTTGQVHLIACRDDTHHWVELHPLSPDPATWGDPANWSAPLTLTDTDGAPLVQGNSFVAAHDGGYLMAFNEIAARRYYLRESVNLTEGWSAARLLALDERVNGGDSENLLVLPGGGLRFYISNGNALKKVMWQVDSADGGQTWTAPRVMVFEGFGPEGVNWAEIYRSDALTDMTGLREAPGGV